VGGDKQVAEWVEMSRWPSGWRQAGGQVGGDEQVPGGQVGGDEQVPDGQMGGDGQVAEQVETSRWPSGWNVMAYMFESCSWEGVVQGGVGKAMTVNIMGTGYDAGKVPLPPLPSDTDDGVS